MVNLNDAVYNSIAGEGIRYEAKDINLNPFDFSSRDQQKEGPSDELLPLKKGLQVLVISEDGRHLETGVVIDFEAPNCIYVEESVKSYGLGISNLEQTLREWYKNHPLLPKVQFSNGKVSLIACRLWTARCNSRATGWRVQLPIRHAAAISLAKGQELVLDKILVNL
jgi:hypothetical protein